MSGSLFARLARRFGPRVTSEDRRGFLKASAAVGAAMLLSNAPGCNKLQNTSEVRPTETDKFDPTATPPPRRVIVIGAGFAGLAAAHELRAAGYPVIVLEATHTVGGRVQTFNDFPKGKVVEGGGELIGSNHPTWAAYKEKFGLEFRDVTEDETLNKPVILSGKALTSEEAEALYKEMDAVLGTLNADASKVNPDEPWASPNAAEWDRRTVAQWLASVKCSDLCRHALQTDFSANNATATDKMSYLGLLTEISGGGVEKYWTDSEVFRCASGNQSLAVKLASSLPLENVIYGAIVQAVSLRPDGVIVVTRDGKRYEGTDVVFTAPPSVWPKINITPGLPAELRPQMGRAVKYFSRVKKRFWTDAQLSPDALSDGPVSLTWDGTDNQSGDDNVLTAFSGGPAAEACAASPNEANRNKLYGDELSKLYPKYKENLLETRFMNFVNAPYVLGGYSFPAPGQVTTLGPMLARGHAAPSGVVRLHFAGEHTCYKFVGYMEGGLSSGVAAARRILARDTGAKTKGASRRDAIRAIIGAASA